MAHLSIHDLPATETLDAKAMSAVRGGIWDYSNRLGMLGQMFPFSAKCVLMTSNTCA